MKRLRRQLRALFDRSRLDRDVLYSAYDMALLKGEPETIAEMLKPVRTNRFVIRCSLEFSEYFATYHRHAEPYKLQFQIPMIHQYLSNDHARRNKAERR